MTCPPFPSSPLIQLSLRDIFLSQPHGRSSDPNPIFGLHNPFKQSIPPFSDSTNSTAYALYQFMEGWDYIDRISMSTVIPELGVVVIATPKGRAAVLSLCQTRPTGFSPATRKRKDPIYYFRLEWLLPFESQEELGLRPIRPYLIGLVAGPLQGMLGPAQLGVTRRWRLILTFRDHTVLSYELGRNESSFDGQLDVQPSLF